MAARRRRGIGAAARVRACGLENPYLEDYDNPPAGKVQFSLITGIFGTQESSLGENGDRIERPNRHPCP